MMNTSPKNTTSTIIPGLRYKDAPAALDWLEHAFGFKRSFVVEGENNIIEHAQVTFGNGMIMLGSADKDQQYDQLVRMPEELGAESQAPYVIVEDADAHYAHAKQAGARIVMEIHSPDYGGRAYSAYDPEGHLWNFGTYDPWAENH
jgi:uncharacterized glyoxalase superfamily protein PhnB